jgi:hypothetical protein
MERDPRAPPLSSFLGRAGRYEFAIGPLCVRGTASGVSRLAVGESFLKRTALGPIRERAAGGVEQGWESQSSPEGLQTPPGVRKEIDVEDLSGQVRPARFRGTRHHKL